MGQTLTIEALPVASGRGKEIQGSGHWLLNLPPESDPRHSIHESMSHGGFQEGVKFELTVGQES